MARRDIIEKEVNIQEERKNWGKKEEQKKLHEEWDKLFESLPRDIATEYIKQAMEGKVGEDAGKEGEDAGKQSGIRKKAAHFFEYEAVACTLENMELQGKE